MKVILSKHVKNRKIPLLKSLGWNINRVKIKRTIQNPGWTGVTKYNQPTAMSLMDDNHILRVIFNQQKAENHGFIRG